MFFTKKILNLKEKEDVMKQEKEIRNPVSRKIVLNSVWNSLHNYFPRIIRTECGGPFGGYDVGARLPEEAHKKWISYINGLERFREVVSREIEEVFSRYVFDVQSYIEIWWSPGGVTFNTDGNACGIYVSGGPDFGYSSHNVDHYEQASVLFIALSIYLVRLYSALEAFESESIPVEKCQPLEKELRQRIKLNQQKECDMTYDECLHWKSYLCQYCSRNPKAFFLSEKRNLYQMGDKWEPEGGLPGRNFCRSCHANISKPVCPHCGMDNSDDFR